jgi:hypothetical protein
MEKYKLTKFDYELLKRLTGCYIEIIDKGIIKAYDRFNIFELKSSGLNRLNKLPTYKLLKVDDILNNYILDYD